MRTDIRKDDTMQGFMSSGPPWALEELVRYVSANLEGFIRAEDVVPGVKALFFETAEDAVTAQWIMSLNGAREMDIIGKEGEDDERTDAADAGGY